MDQSKELLFCVDTNNNPLVPKLRGVCHGDPTHTHRVVHVLVQNTRGEILAQKRSARKRIQAGKWDTAVGGHLDPGEDILQGAIREFREELGIQPEKLTRIYDYLWLSDMESERVATFHCIMDGPFRFLADEIDAIRFFPLETLRRMERDDLLTPNFLFEIETFTRYLKQGKKRIRTAVPVYPIRQICTCRKCSRLMRFRSGIKPLGKYTGTTYWNRPVPGFGDLYARLLIVGLAPGAHGANRTGRPFTGDYAGKILFAALHAAGVSNQPVGAARGDGLWLKKVFITNAVKCVPPDNRPASTEIAQCQQFLMDEIRCLPDLKAILVLGRTAFSVILRLLKKHFDTRLTTKSFSHGAVFSVNNGSFSLICSYHPSRRNIQTRKMSESQFKNIIETAVQISDIFPEQL